MKVVRADFSVRPPVLQWTALAIAVTGLAVAAFQVQLGFGYRQRALMAEEDSIRLRDTIARRDAVPPAPSAFKAPYFQDAAAVAQVSAYDFGRVLTALENVQVPNIKVSSMELIAAEASARIDVEFTEAAALSRYLDELNAGLSGSAGRWRVSRAQMPTPTVPGAATIVAPADIGISDTNVSQRTRR